MSNIVYSSHTNAYAICRGVQSLGLRICTSDMNPVFPITPIDVDDKVFWLFFTEESSLRRALEGDIKGEFSPKNFPLDLLDNKWTFAEWLIQHPRLTQGLRHWSLEASKQVEFPCLLKAKHSWVDAKKLPRGWICHNQEELESHFLSLELMHLNKDHFFIQEWLGDKDCEVISVCGYYDFNDNDRNLTAVVKRIASHTDGLSCSAAIETIDDKWFLNEETKKILDALKFSGPFELEFLISGLNIYVLELNPRFWMQHAIFLSFGNGLIKRYLRVETPSDLELKELPPIVWIDGLHILKSILKLQPKFLLFTLMASLKSSKKILIWPSLPISILVSLRIVFFSLLKKIK
jgi:hypothetical protein